MRVKEVAGERSDVITTTANRGIDSATFCCQLLSYAVSSYRHFIDFVYKQLDKLSNQKNFKIAAY